MKYICLTFDDGFKDFKDNALPLLKKYGFKASINIITGYSDKTIKTEYDYLSIDDIKELYNDGFEIAVHSNSHPKKVNIEDFEIAKKKLSSWLGEDKFGLVVPYSQSIGNDVFEYAANNYIYICDYSHHEVKRNLPLFLNRVFNKISRTEIGDFLVSNQYYLYKKEHIKKSIIFYFNRLPARRDNTPNKIFQFIKKMNDNCCITIVFHSIVNSLNEKVDWPDGMWTKDELEFLLKSLSKEKNILVLTQKELVKGAKNGN